MPFVGAISLLALRRVVVYIRRNDQGGVHVPARVRHKVFLSYHHKDQEDVDDFIRTFDHQRDVFIVRAIGSDKTMDRLIDSENPEYVMRRIREGTLSDSTVTLVFIGSQTWSRKYVD